METVGVGELAGLAAAACWALGGVLFSKVRAPPSAINLFKNVVGGTCLAAGVVLAAGPPSGVFAAMPWLVPSAFIGIVIGDTCHFAAIQGLGARRAIVMETLAPVFAALAGFLWLGERLVLREWLGILVTLGGVVLAVGADPADRRRPRFSPRAGVALGAAAALSQAAGAALSKVGMREMAQAGCGAVALHATWLRLAVAAVAGLGLAAAAGRLARDARRLARGVNLRFGLPAALFGTSLGISASMVAFERAPLGVATTLCATSPILVLPIARMLGDRFGRRAVAGAVVAVVGVALLLAS